MDGLRSTLETYKLQLAQIELAISGGQEDEELLILQDEMKELISLTEESIISYEKSRLLSLLEEPQQKETNTAQPAASSNSRSTHCQNKNEDIDYEMTSFYAGLEMSGNSTSDNLSNDNAPSNKCSNSPEHACKPQPATPPVPIHDLSCDNDIYESNFESNEEFLETIENCNDITGTKCQAPYRTEWSGCQYHNAMIMSVVDSSEAPAESNDVKNIFVKVLYLNPTLDQMKPCPFLLDGNCKFTAADCKFCHGHTISLYELRKFQEPDFSTFVLNSSCLAKHTDGIWQPAILDQILDNHQYIVRFKHQNLKSTLDIDHIFPTPHNDDADSSDSDEEDDIVVVCDPQTTTSDSSTIGAWEEHTKGFGSKMLMKYGYKLGDGLGKDKKGRVEPVPVVVLPAGKSLDHCMKIKERKMGINENANAARRRHRHTVFNFLNKTLGDRKPAENRLRKILPKDSFGIKKSKSGPCKLSAELLKNDTTIKHLKDRVRKLKDSVARNQKRDPGVAKKLQLQLDKAQAELKSVQSSTKAIELHQHRADTHRKMTRF